MTSLSASIRALSLTGLMARLRSRRAIAPGISAIIVKELRARMRGRRAFVAVTVYLLLLGGIAWMIQRIAEDQAIAMLGCFGCGGGATFASASVGQGIFIGLLMLQTLIVAVLAPASTAGTISGERERQTLDLLTVTPISSTAIVLGKLLSALAWIFVLILTSLPITGLVFVFGGAAPDDLIRGYLILFATALGLGSVGLFFSALIRRTGAATGLTYVATLVLVLGSAFVFVFFASTGQVSLDGSRRGPEAILYLNPFVAEADVACGTESGSGSWCSLIGAITGTANNFASDASLQGGFQTLPDGSVVQIAPAIPVGKGGFMGPGVNVPIPAFVPVVPLRDRFWPRSVIALVILSAVMLLLTVQLVSPTRRWRPRVRVRFRRRR